MEAVEDQLMESDRRVHGGGASDLLAGLWLGLGTGVAGSVLTMALAGAVEHGLAWLAIVNGLVFGCGLGGVGHRRFALGPAWAALAAVLSPAIYFAAIRAAIFTTEIGPDAIGPNAAFGLAGFVGGLTGALLEMLLLCTLHARLWQPTVIILPVAVGALAGALALPAAFVFEEKELVWMLVLHMPWQGAFLASLFPFLRSRA
ncbi:MAG: hypothetical protein ACP5DX_14875 [Paracoccaceae bacterium]